MIFGQIPVRGDVITKDNRVPWEPCIKTPEEAKGLSVFEKTEDEIMTEQAGDLIQEHCVRVSIKEL